MHLDTEQLLDLLHGDVPPEHADASLDHLEGCSECSATFDLMVELRAHRHEALGAMAVLDADAAPAGRPAPEPIPHPASTAPPSPSWKTRGLRLAASLALAALLGVLMWSAPIVQLDPSTPDDATREALAALATNEFDQVWRTSPHDSDVRLTAGSAADAAVADALEYLEDGRPEMAVATLLELGPEAGSQQIVQLHLGIARYLAGDADAAISTLVPLDRSDDSLIWRPAAWYRANALLKDGRAREALTLLQKLTRPQQGQPVSGGLFLRQAEQLQRQVQALISDTSAP